MEAYRPPIINNNSMNFATERAGYNPSIKNNAGLVESRPQERKEIHPNHKASKEERPSTEKKPVKIEIDEQAQDTSKNNNEIPSGSEEDELRMILIREQIGKEADNENKKNSLTEAMGKVITECLLNLHKRAQILKNDGKEEIEIELILMTYIEGLSSDAKAVIGPFASIISRAAVGSNSESDFIAALIPYKEEGFKKLKQRAESLFNPEENLKEAASNGKIKSIEPSTEKPKRKITSLIHGLSSYFNPNKSSSESNSKPKNAQSQNQIALAA